MHYARTVRFASALCYLPFASVVAGLVTLLKFPHIPFAVFHVRQAFALFIVWFFSLVLVSSVVWIGILFWLVLAFFSVRVGFTAWLGREVAFPGLSTLTRYIPVGAIYTHLTGSSFPHHTS